LFNSFVNKNLLESQIIECIWTIIPAIILIQIAIPSLLLLYMLDESIDSNLTIKAIGHQWYWRYEYRDFWAIGRGSQVEFDAYMIQIWDPNMIFKYETQTWYSNMRPKHGIQIYDSNMRPKHDIQVYDSNRRSKHDIQICDSNILFKYEIQTWYSNIWFKYET